MTTNNVFTRSNATEQSFYESMIIEAIQIHGHDVKYIPRDVVNKDELFGEDILSQFVRSYDIEMYVDTSEGYEGSDMFRKFGIEIRDESELTVARSRWNTVVGTPEDQTRPFEGDLIYVPFSKSVFEITHVEHENPFYQIGHLPTYKLSISLFEFNDEKIDVDGIAEEAFTDAYMRITTATAGAYQVGEEVTQTQTDGIVSGIIAKVDGTSVEVSNVTSENGEFNLFEPTFNLVGSDSGVDLSVSTVETIDTIGDNEAIEDLADTVIVFDETNPFGDI